MYFIESASTDPHFNIATEEFLLRETNEEFFMLYIDEPSIIVGKHQNTMAEINYRFVIENNIPVIRRISGGGTVFHDLGNLNFCFIANSREGKQIDFKKYTTPIISALHKLGINACLEGKNDIRVNGLKVSGNAEHVFKNRVLHHGTLLINSDLKNLSAALQIVPGRYIDNAVKSIRSKVANLNSFQPELTVDKLKLAIKEEIATNSPIENYTLSTIELQSIQEKVTDKFGTWEWNYGYSPNYAFNGNDIELKVENGIITEAQIEMNLDLQKKIVGKTHQYAVLKLLDDNAWMLF